MTSEPDHRPANQSEVLARYEARIRQVRPDLVIETISLNDDGLVNDVVVVNEALIFRFGRHPWAAADLQQEARCLALAREHVAVRLPAWTVHAPDFISYARIPGLPLQRHDLLRWPEPDQEAVAARLGVFLHQLHTIPGPTLEAHGIGHSATRRRREDWLQLYADVQEELWPLLMPTAREWVQQHFAPLLADPEFMAAPETMMNGDLAPYHLLVDPASRRLTGIIDFGTAGRGDSACDFACLIDSYGESFVRRVARHYPDDLAGQIDRARFWAGTLELQWLLAARRRPEDPGWAGVHIGRARDVRPIGSAW